MIEGEIDFTPGLPIHFKEYPFLFEVENVVIYHTLDELFKAH